MGGGKCQDGAEASRALGRFSALHQTRAAPLLEQSRLEPPADPVRIELCLQVTSNCPLPIVVNQAPLNDIGIAKIPRNGQSQAK